MLTGTEGLDGEIVITLRFAAGPVPPVPPPPVPPPPVPPPPVPLPEPLTVRVAEADIAPDEAEMVTVPAAIPFTTPGLAMDAMAVFEEVHCAEDVTSFVLPSE